MHARSKLGNAMSETNEPLWKTQHAHLWSWFMSSGNIWKVCWGGKNDCKAVVCVCVCFLAITAKGKNVSLFRPRPQMFVLIFTEKNILKMMMSTFSSHSYDVFILLLPKTLLNIEKLSQWKTFLHCKGRHPLSVSMQQIFVNVCHWKLRQGFSQGRNVTNLSYWYLLDSVCSSAYCSRETSLSSFNFSHSFHFFKHIYIDTLKFLK